MKTKIRFVILAILFLAFSSSCAHVPTAIPPDQAGFSMDESMKKEYPYTEIKEGKGLVIFLRPSIYAPAVKFAVFANGKKLGPIEAESYRIYNADPGLNTFMVKGPEGKPEEHVINIDAGKVYFLHIRATTGTWVARPKSQFISLEEGRQLLKDCTQAK